MNTEQVLFDPEKETDLTMSNFDHTIDDGFEEALKAGMWGRHAGWNFNAKVRWDGTQFHSEVWRYCSKVDDIYADTLKDLMDSTNNEYGWE